ncbi:MAG: TIM barrel protein, partial [Armatimonadetes bacterium]|nr:TIM barrel protein [Armatimonadota bacterium]
MFRNANWGAIGVGVGFEEGLDLAVEVGFEGVEVPIEQAADMVDRESAAAFQALYSERGLLMGSWGLGVDWRGEEESFRASLAKLPRLAQAGREVGATRCCTWVPSWSDERDWESNWQFHIERFGACAKILADHDCRLGLEFIGPATLRAGKRYEFVYSLPQMMELCAAIGPNVGLLLDA